LLKSKHAGKSSLSLLQSRLADCAEKIAFNRGKPESSNGWTGNKDQIHWTGKFALVQAVAFPQEPPNPAADDCAADFFAGDHAEAGLKIGWARSNVGNKTPADQSLAVGAGASKVGRLLDTAGARETQAQQRVAGHER
jgi:hypothetical protein